MALVVAIVGALIASVAWLTTRQIVMDQLDTQVRAAADRQLRPSRNPGQGPRGAGELGNPIGTIFVQSDSGSVRAGVVREGGLDSLSPDAIQTLLAVPADGRPRTIHLNDLGDYRVLVRQDADRLGITALPLHNAGSLLRTLALVSLGLVLLAVLAAVLITRWVVVRALQPLHRVSATATKVSTLNLEHGEVQLPQRVAARDAEPTSEVGQVGHALNHLLTTVESALMARQQSESRVRRFVADASHELRNPLASIRGWAELTRHGREDLPPTTARALERIDAESARMGVLVDELLLLARLDADQELDLKPVDAVAATLDAVTDTRASAPHHQWLLNLPDQPVEVMADPMRLAQVLANVASNARKHTPPGTTVQVEARVAEPGWAEVSITDDGPGVPVEIRDRVFERFARADAARAHADEPSTGLGLSIVKALVEAMGGSVRLSSEPGRTQFVLRFRQAEPSS